MIDQKHLDLIHGEIDGENSQRDSASLREYLNHNPEARGLYNDLASMSAFLSKVEEVEPSQNLKKRILNSIPLQKHGAVEKRRFLGIPVPSPSAQTRVRLAVVFAAGLVFGFIGYALLLDSTGKKTSLDFSHMYGTISPSQPAGTLQPGESIEFNLDVVSGTLATKSSKNILFAELEIKADQEVNIVFSYEPAKLDFRGFSEHTTTRNALAVETGQFRLSHSGENRYLIAFENRAGSAASLDFRVHDKSGAVVFEKTLSAAKERP